MTSFDELRMRLQANLPPGLIAACCGTDGDLSSLSNDEWSAVSAATPKRQREFAAGRAAARWAIRRLGGHYGSIPACTDRSPRWPVGIVGSIAHSSEVCVVVVGLQSTWRSVGIDIEPDQGIEKTLWDIICSPEELSSIQVEPSDLQAVRVAEVFVAKEALYKWHYPLKNVLFDFHAITLTWHEGRRLFRATARDAVVIDEVNELEGQLLHVEGCLVAFCATRPPPSVGVIEMKTG